MSAVTPIADKGGCGLIVCFVPIADITVEPDVTQIGGKENMAFTRWGG